MAELRIVVDCCLPNDWIQFLVAAGFNAVEWREVGPSGALDEEIVDWATENNAVVLTQDLDFGSILSLYGLTKPSVI